MARKNVTVRILEEAATTIMYESFGYKLESKSMTPHSVRLSFFRDNRIPNIKQIKKLEKQYKRVGRFPFSMIVFAVLGAGCLISGFLLLYLMWTIALIVFGFMFLTWFGYCLFTYILIRPKRYTLRRELLLTAKELSGVSVLYPIPGSIASKGEYTYALKNAFHLK